MAPDLETRAAAAGRGSGGSTARQIVLLMNGVSYSIPYDTRFVQQVPGKYNRFTAPVAITHLEGPNDSRSIETVVEFSFGVFTYQGMRVGVVQRAEEARSDRLLSVSFNWAVRDVQTGNPIYLPLVNFADRQRFADYLWRLKDREPAAPFAL